MQNTQLVANNDPLPQSSAGASPGKDQVADRLWQPGIRPRLRHQQCEPRGSKGSGPVLESISEMRHEQSCKCSAREETPAFITEQGLNGPS